MNRDTKLIVQLALVLMCILTPLLVFGQTAPQSAPDFSHIDKAMAVNCSKRSTDLNRKAMLEAGKTMQETKNSILSTPAMRLQARTNLMLAIRNYEGLVSECAIWLRLGGGSI